MGDLGCRVISFQAIQLRLTRWRCIWLQYMLNNKPVQVLLGLHARANINQPRVILIVNQNIGQAIGLMKK